MLRFNYSIVSKIALSLLVIIILVGGIIFFSQDKLFQEKTKQSSIVKALPEFLTKLQKAWQTGDLERAQSFNTKECQIFKNYEHSEELLACNPLYFNCLISEMERAKFSDFEVKGSKFIPQKNSQDEYLDPGSQFVSLSVFEKNSKRLFKVRLQKSCRSKKLPASQFSAGPQIESSFVWDNYLFDVYIDRYYVNRYDVLSWAESKGMPELMLAMEGEDKLFEPALTLSANTQKRFCLDQGKQLLESRFFDAATFYPSREQNIYKYPFTWTKSRETFLNSEDEVSSLNCQNAFVKECYKFSKKEQIGFTSVSWMGIFHSLGGHAEHFENRFNPDANLKLSHSNLERMSPWHRAGLRAYWDGAGLNENSFEFVEQYTGRLIDSTGSIMGVAFRCMEIR